MVMRLLCLCGVEAVIVALLAWQVFAAPSAGPMVTPDATAAVAPSPASAAAANGATVDPPAADAPIADAAQRALVTAVQRSDDPVGVLLTGRVSFADGSPATAYVRLTREGERRGRVEQAGDGGCYALVGLRPGAWKVALSGDGVADEELEIELGEAAVQQRDFVVTRMHMLRVRIVTPDGQDGAQAMRKVLPEWADFTVIGGSEPFPERFGPTDYGMVFVGDAKWSPDRNGSEGQAGTLGVRQLPAHVALLQRHLVLQQQVVAAGQELVEFVVDPDALRASASSVTVRVLDAETGAPLSDARGAWWTSNRGGGGWPVDADGRLVLEGLSPGWLQGTITCKDHEPYLHSLLFAPGQQVDLGDVRLGPIAALRGKVVGVDGKLGECRLQANPLKWRSSPSAARHNHFYQVEADGSFELRFGAGPIAIRASNGTAVAVGVFDNPSTTPVVLQLAPPGECVVTRPPDPQRSFVLTLRDLQGRVVDAWDLEARRSTMTLQMPFGCYRYEAHDDSGRQVATGEVTFGATPTKVEIR